MRTRSVELNDITNYQQNEYGLCLAESKITHIMSRIGVVLLILILVFYTTLYAIS